MARLRQQLCSIRVVEDGVQLGRQLRHEHLSGSPVHCGRWGSLVDHLFSEHGAHGLDAKAPVFK